MYTRSLTLNLSDLVTFCLLSDFSLLMEIFYNAIVRAYLMDLRSRRSFSCLWYLIVGERSFLRGVRGSLLKSRKNRLSLEWLTGNILKLQSENYGVSSQSDLLWMCFLTQGFRNEWNFCEMPLDCGWWGLKNWSFRHNSDVTFWKSSHLSFCHHTLFG